MNGAKAYDEPLDDFRVGAAFDDERQNLELAAGQTVRRRGTGIWLGRSDQLDRCAKRDPTSFDPSCIDAGLPRPAASLGKHL